MKEIFSKFFKINKKEFNKSQSLIPNVDLYQLAKNSDRVEISDDEISIEFDFQNDFLAISFHPKHIDIIEYIPSPIKEVLQQLKNIDDRVQKHWNAASENPIGRHNPQIIYMIENGEIFIDYWGVEVNNQRSVYLNKDGSEWVPNFNHVE